MNSGHKQIPSSFPQTPLGGTIALHHQGPGAGMELFSLAGREG